jgi:AAT family amino acid transporter
MTEQKNDVTLQEEDQTLQRGIHPWMANLIALGGIIGSCYFVGSGWVIQELGVSAAFAFMLGGLIIWVVMQSFAELLVNLPRRGSFVAYSNEFISPLWAVGTGWSYWFNWVAYVPSEAVAGGIIMNSLFPWLPVPGWAWAFIFLVIITVINLSHVESFGYIESVLAIFKITAVAIFSIIAFLLVTGILGGHPIGISILLPDGKLTYSNLFPAGGFTILLYLVTILVNFQGSEIIGLAAAETRDPETTVPKACRQVTYRIIGVYVIPIVFLVLILSREDSGLDGSMFAAALQNYSESLGIPWLGWIASGFAVVVLSAAFSCANSGMFGTVRSMYALSLAGMAPKKLSKLNKKGVPQTATIFTLICCWAMLLVNLFFGESDTYAVLISISGFSGTICWLSICMAQVNFRKKVLARGYKKSDLRATIPFSPFLPLIIGVALEAVGLLLMVGDPREGAGFLAAGDPILQKAFIASMIGLCLPMIVFAIAKKQGKITMNQKLAIDEKSFDDTFPPKA